MESSSDQDVYSEEVHLKNYVKHMLRGKIFVGTYVEKRYIENINGYRDVVKISNNETELIADLSAMVKRLRDTFKSPWIGITMPETVGAPVGYCLWVELEHQVFGSYWYKIKSVRFRRNEIIVQLKQVRTIREVTSEVQQTQSEFNLQENMPPFNEVLLEKLQAAAWNVSKVMTPENIKATVIFISLLIATIFTGTVQLFKYLMDYSLKFMRESSIFIKAVTPVLISIVRMFEKIFGGLYILIAMMWRDSGSPTRNQQDPHHHMINYNVPQLTYRKQNRRMVIEEVID